ncbi:MAG: carboxypeptidase-like regulatory domain-containing protein [Bacteroidia bacterium]
MKALILFLFMISLGYGQTKISGQVTDSITGLPVSFANIGIVGKPLGTICDEKGLFELAIPGYAMNDTLRVGIIGHHTRSFLVKDFIKRDSKNVKLSMQATELETVTVKAKKVKYKMLGTTNYTKNNCTGFADIEGNWKGSEAAILIHNDKDIFIENFSFYVIQNKYADSLLFRLNFYQRISPPPNSPKIWGENWVGPTLLKRPIIFKLGINQGEFTLPLREYNIHTSGDFFVSLECLMDEMEIKKFCYSGSPGTESFFKIKAFSKWHRTPGRSGGGGADFNVKVSYVK